VLRCKVGEGIAGHVAARRVAARRRRRPLRYGRPCPDGRDRGVAVVVPLRYGARVIGVISFPSSASTSSTRTTRPARGALGPGLVALGTRASTRRSGARPRARKALLEFSRELAASEARRVLSRVVELTGRDPGLAAQPPFCSRHGDRGAERRGGLGVEERRIGPSAARYGAGSRASRTVTRSRSCFKTPASFAGSKASPSRRRPADRAAAPRRRSCRAASPRARS